MSSNLQNLPPFAEDDSDLIGPPGADTRLVDHRHCGVAGAEPAGAPGCAATGRLADTRLINSTDRGTTTMQGDPHTTSLKETERKPMRSLGGGVGR
ncbi:hypothetical protein [Micromonospora coerulea]|uniref:hypothetical protein n=1 Tax=Micromonospora coerulea TaxID=47856 RepID=UPI0031F72D71